MEVIDTHVQIIKAKMYHICGAGTNGYSDVILEWVLCNVHYKLQDTIPPVKSENYRSRQPGFLGIPILLSSTDTTCSASMAV